MEKRNAIMRTVMGCLFVSTIVMLGGGCSSTSNDVEIVGQAQLDAGGRFTGRKFSLQDSHYYCRYMMPGDKPVNVPAKSGECAK